MRVSGNLNVVCMYVGFEVYCTADGSGSEIARRMGRLCSGDANGARPFVLCAGCPWRSSLVPQLLFVH